MQINHIGVSRLISPLKIALPYLFIGLSYILFSDYILSESISQSRLLYQIESIKGVAFIVITAIMLYFLVNRHSKLLINHYESLIAEIKSTEKQAKISEEKYMHLFDVGPLPMWIFDKETLAFKLVNRAAIEKYGYSKEEFLNMSIKDIRPKDDQGLLYTVLNNYGSEVQKKLPTTFRHLTKSGQQLLVKIERVNVEFDNKSSILVIVTDITQSVENEKKLVQSYQRLHSASTIANVGYWSIDLISGKMHCSKILKEILEFSHIANNLSWKMLIRRIHPDDVSKVFRQLKNRENPDRKFDLEFRVITECGNLKWVRQRLKPNRDKNGEIQCLEGILVDISVRKFAEEEASKNLERYKMLSKTVFEAIVDWDATNNTLYLSEGFSQLFGYDINQDISHLWIENIYHEDKKRVIDDLKKALSNPNQFEYFDEYRFVKANSELAYVQHKGVFERNSEGKVVRALGAINDISESISKIRKINSQSEKLSRFVWTHSHIVRSPLVSILGLVELLKSKDPNLVQNTDEILDMIYLSAEKLDKAIHDLTIDVNNEVATDQDSQDA